MYDTQEWGEDKNKKIMLCRRGKRNQINPWAEIDNAKVKDLWMIYTPDRSLR